MTPARWFIVAVCVLQLGAVASFAFKRRWPEALMFFGACVANAAAAFIPAR